MYNSDYFGKFRKQAGMGTQSYHSVSEKGPLSALHTTNDVEAEAQMPTTHRGRPRSSSRVGLKTAILCTAVYGVYYLTTSTLSWATQSAIRPGQVHRDAGTRWAIKAFGGRDAYRVDDPEAKKAEELYL